MIFSTQIVVKGAGNVMKKIIGKFFSGILVFFVVLLLGVCLIVTLPFDYVKYKWSPYYKKERKKYRLFAGSGDHFEIYNDIIKNNLPIQFIENTNEESLDAGWFVFNNILIIPNVFYFEFDLESQGWVYYVEDEDEKRTVMPLDEYIELEIQGANEQAGRTICNDAVVLIDTDYIENIDAAKNEKRFLLYDNNREEVLKQFCGNII